MKPSDLTGRRFGKLVAVSHYVTRNGSGRSKRVWVCLCDCGIETRANPDNLKNGTTKSCGCLRTDVCLERTKHGMCGTPEYNAWAGMMARCYRISSPDYPHWGGRGVDVCKRWHDATAFLLDMGKKPEGDYSLDRIDNSKGYSNDNCRWASRSQQNKNRRPFGSRSIDAANQM